MFKIRGFIGDSLKPFKSNAYEAFTVRIKIGNDAKHFTCMASSTPTSSLQGTC